MNKFQFFLESIVSGATTVHIAGAKANLPDFVQKPVVLLGFSIDNLDQIVEISQSKLIARPNFNGVRHTCLIPWESVFAITNPNDGHRGFIWEDDCPVGYTKYLNALRAYNGK